MQEEINRTVGESLTAAPENAAVLESKRGGKREGSGRKKSKRELIKVTVNIYKDQTPITDAKIRAAIDLYISSHSG